MRAAALFTLLLPICAEHHRYLIIGAGPGGLQMAHYLQSAGRDYLLLEKSNRTANFFHYAPSWRELISINKRNVGTKLLDFNLRHGEFTLRFPLFNSETCLLMNSQIGIRC